MIRPRDDAAAPARVRRHWPLLLLTVGALLLSAALLAAWRSGGQVEEFGPKMPSAPAPTAHVPRPQISPRPVPAGPPRWLDIPAIAVAATVRPAGIDEATGEVDVPRSVDVVGWYRFGPDLAARAGSIVIAGHVDSAKQGKGAFYRLRDLRAGDQVTVTGAGGASRVYTVESRRVYAKSAVPLDRIFARDGPPRLRLITCGGAFDRRTGHYQDNIVVTAAPA